MPLVLIMIVKSFLSFSMYASVCGKCDEDVLPLVMPEPLLQERALHAFGAICVCLLVILTFEKQATLCFVSKLWQIAEMLRHDSMADRDARLLPSCKELVRSGILVQVNHLDPPCLHPLLADSINEDDTSVKSHITTEVFTRSCQTVKSHISLHSIYYIVLYRRATDGTIPLVLQNQPVFKPEFVRHKGGNK